MRDSDAPNPAEPPSPPLTGPTGAVPADRFQTGQPALQARLAANEPPSLGQFVTVPRAAGGTELVSPALADLAESAARYAENSSGPGTQAAYRSAWKTFSNWCEKIGREPLSGDPGLLALYLTKRAEDGLAVSSLQVARAAIRAAHRLAGVPLNLDDSRLGLVMEGIVRTHGVRPRRRAAPAVPDVLRRLLTALAGLEGLPPQAFHRLTPMEPSPAPPAPNTPAAAAPALAARHRAMLLIGFGAALRRSEIVSLTVDDIAVVENRGLTVLVRRSKTDQHGKGQTIAMWANHRDPDFCPVTAFEAWMGFRKTASDWTSSTVEAAAEPPALPHERARNLEASQAAAAWRAEKPLFCGITSAGALMGGKMSDKIVARLMKQACRLAGLDPKKFSGHSLRRGLLTTAGDLQLPLVDLMRQSRHKSVDTALSYIESGDAWRNNITEPVFGGGRNR